MPPILTGSPHIRPFAPEFVGAITADGQTTRVAAIALTTLGKVALLSLVANDTTVSAATARLFKGEQLRFAVCAGMRWDGATIVGRADQVSYHQIKAAIPNTREKHYLVVPHTGDIGEGILRPDTIAASISSSEVAQKVAKPPRFIFANHDEAGPNARAFLGHLRALRVVFLPHWADRLWADGIATHLITPLPSLGIAAWQIENDQARWQQLVSEAICTKRLTRHTLAIAA